MIYLVYITIGYFLYAYYQGITAENKILENDDEFRKIEYALKEWIAQKRYCEYEQSREEIAKELNTTKESLHHYFLSRKGMDFNAWRTELRIEEAKKMLIENMDYSVNIVGELCGFSDRSNFHRQFVKMVGCSPKQWRESGGKL
jgi:AraC-like DNA-binding protein